MHEPDNCLICIISIGKGVCSYQVDREAVLLELSALNELVNQMLQLRGSYVPGLKVNIE